MITFVDKLPTIEPHGDGFLATFKSGDQSIQLMLTRHVLIGLGPVVSAARAKATVAEFDRDVIKFPKRKRRR